MHALNSRVKVLPSDSTTIDKSFVGRVGTVTAIYPEDENYSEETYTVSLPDGRHDMFFADELRPS